MTRTSDDTHVFTSGLTRADVRDIVNTAYARRERRARRSMRNCQYVREQMRVREPRIAAAYDRYVERN